MKTLTELSGITIRKAAAAIAEAKRLLPKAEPAVEAAPPAPAVVVSVPAAAPAEGEAAAAPVAEGEVAAAAAPAPAPAPVSPPKAKGPPPEVPETEEEKAALDAAVTAATGLSGDRLARMRDAVVVTGRRIDDVRLVRVFGPEEPVPGATTRNGFQYVVDFAPASLRQVTEPKRERGGRGGSGGRGGGGGAGGGGGKGAPKSGGFSMDALKDDRKGQRSGPGGGGRGGRPPGGGGGGKPR
jgi:translation initiation factor IF-2